MGVGSANNNLWVPSKERASGKKELSQTQIFISHFFFM
jgi:hypothetical protein